MEVGEVGDMGMEGTLLGAMGSECSVQMRFC